jgi:hypothetical protein
LKNLLRQFVFNRLYAVIIESANGFVTGLCILTPSKGLKISNFIEQLRGYRHLNLFTPFFARSSQCPFVAVLAFDRQVRFIACLALFVQSQKEDAARFEITLDIVDNIADVDIAVGVDCAMDYVFLVDMVGHFID